MNTPKTLQNIYEVVLVNTIEKSSNGNNVYTLYINKLNKLIILELNYSEYYRLCNSFL